MIYRSLLGAVALSVGLWTSTAGSQVFDGIACSDGVTMSFQRDGRVADIFVKVGDRVNAGDPLLDFGASPLAVIAYVQAKTTLSAAKWEWQRAHELLKQQRATFDQVDAAAKVVAQAQLVVETFERQGSIRPSEIMKASLDGAVTAISVARGDRVPAGAPLMTLCRM
jgi:multidrug resistance efflux pump